METFKFNNTNMYEQHITLAIKDMIQNFSDISASNYIFKTIKAVEDGFEVSLIASSVEHNIFVSNSDIAHYHLIKTVDMSDYVYRLGNEFDTFVSETNHNLYQKKDK